MSQPLPRNRALYGSAPRWLLPAVFGGLLLIGLLQRRSRRRATS
jgi:hypothetical protein